MRPIMSGLWVGAISLTIGACGGGNGGEDTTAPTTPTTGAVEGLVEDDVGSPVSDLTVRLRSSGGDADLATRQTGSNGTYRFADLEPGGYDVLIDVSSIYDLNGQANPVAVQVSAGQTAAADFMLRLRAGTVTGTALDESSDPVQGATAALRPAGGTQTLASASTDAGGMYELQRVAIGEYDVALTPPPGFEVTGENPRRVTVAEGEASQADFTLSLQPVSFSTDVQPIFTNNCAASGCHGGSNPQEGMSLESGEAWSQIVNVASVQLPSMDRIEPFEPDDSYLVHKIQGTQLDVGGSGQQMPESAEPLPEELIDLIRRWVSEGAADN